MTEPVDPARTPSGEELLRLSSDLPDDAKRLGLTPLTAPDLALISSLRAHKPLHRMMAWVLLGILAVLLVVGLLWR